MVARRAAVDAGLASADATQELSLSALPADTLAVCERKGRVLRAIEDLNRAGKMAFDGDAVQIARFNKDILLRARKARAQAEVPAADVAV